MSRKRVGKMRVRIEADEDYEGFVSLNWGPEGWLDLCRKELGRLFPGMLPKHGSKEKVLVELTARRVKK